MSTLTKRSTIYLDPAIHKALRLKSIETSKSMSELINDAVCDELKEDADDLADFRERENETVLDFEDFVKALKANGTI